MPSCRALCCFKTQKLEHINNMFWRIAVLATRLQNYKSPTETHRSFYRAVWFSTTSKTTSTWWLWTHWQLNTNEDPLVGSSFVTENSDRKPYVFGTKWKQENNRTSHLKKMLKFLNISTKLLRDFNTITTLASRVKSNINLLFLSCPLKDCLPKKSTPQACEKMMDKDQLHPRKLTWNLFQWFIWKGKSSSLHLHSWGSKG